MPSHLRQKRIFLLFVLLHTTVYAGHNGSTNSKGNTSKDDNTLHLKRNEGDLSEPTAEELDKAGLKGKITLNGTLMKNVPDGVEESLQKFTQSMNDRNFAMDEIKNLQCKMSEDGKSVQQMSFEVPKFQGNRNYTPYKLDSDGNPIRKSRGKDTTSPIALVTVTSDPKRNPSLLMTAVPAKYYEYRVVGGTSVQSTDLLSNNQTSDVPIQVKPALSQSTLNNLCSSVRTLYGSKVPVDGIYRLNWLTSNPDQKKFWDIPNSSPYKSGWYTYKDGFNLSIP